jgi:hypothetical protein
MFLRTRIVQDDAITAGGAVRTDDLPVNPLSHILVTVKPQVTTQFTMASLQNMLDVIAKLEILYKGQSIISGSLADLAAEHYFNRGCLPMVGRLSDAAALARSWVTVPILFGPRPFDPEWCFPAVRRGELQMQITPAAAFTNLSSPVLQVETVELLDAQPKRFRKVTTISKTPSATGDHDVDMPLGNPIRGIVLFGTTVPSDAAYTASIQQLRMLVDNVEHGYAFTNWETLWAERGMYTVQALTGYEATSRLAAGAPAGDAATEALEWTSHFTRRYAYLDYSPEAKDDYRLMTGGKGRVHLRINAGAADAIRVLPVEEITIQGATS